MTNHKFVFAEKKNERNIFIVKCPNVKGGEFSTEIWKDRYPKNICICCGEIIDRKSRKK